MFKRPISLQVVVGLLFTIILALLAAGGAQGQTERISNSFAAIAKKVGPAVVSIDIKLKTPPATVAGSGTPGEGGDVLDFLRRQMQRSIRSVGSGFIVDRSGYVLTNAHVIGEAVRITVRLESGEEFAARVVGWDEETDLAVLKIEARRDLPFVKFGDSDKAEVGDWVLAIGSPFGLAKTVTAGIISQTRRETPGTTQFQRFIQTDAAINRGNSGGPLVNMDGEVVGVNSQIATSTGDYNGVGFALPSREAGYVLEQIVKNGKVRRGYLGVLLDSVQEEFASVYGLKETRGSIVTDVRDQRGPAALAGIKTGDVIVEFNGQPVKSAQDLITKIAATLPEQTVTLGYLRENALNLERKSVSIKLGERPVNRLTSGDDTDRRVLPVDGSTAEPKPFGLTLSPLNAALMDKYHLAGQKGLVVEEINPASFIADVIDSLGRDALAEGNLIQRINRITVNDVKAFNEVVSKLKPGDAVVLHVLVYIPSLSAPQLKIVQFTVR